MPDHRLPRTYRSDAQRTSAGRSPGALRTARLIALLAGFAGVLLCALAPLLPVRQTTATILWPQTPDVVGNITAPLVSGAPLSLDATIPCTTVATLPANGGLVLSTNPPGGIDAGRNGLFIRATATDVSVAIRDTVAAVAPRAAVNSGACTAIHVWADLGGVGADFVGGLSVYKTPDVSLSSSSIGATVNVAFPKPFDKPGRRMAVTASGSLQDDAGKIVPTVGIDLMIVCRRDLDEATAPRVGDERARERVTTDLEEAQIEGEVLARRADRARTRRPARARRCRVSGSLLRLPDQAHRPRPLRAQCADRRRQFRRPPARGILSPASVRSGGGGAGHGDLSGRARWRGFRNGRHDSERPDPFVIGDPGRREHVESAPHGGVDRVGSGLRRRGQAQIRHIGASSARVSEPRPGPTSRTVSSGPMPACA